MHLWDRYIATEDKGDKEAMNGIKWVIDREEGGWMWYFIKRVLDDPKNGGILCIERYVNGKLKVNTEQDDMVGCIRRRQSTDSSSRTVLGSLGPSWLRSWVTCRTSGWPRPSSRERWRSLMTWMTLLGMEFLAGNGEMIVVTPEEFKRYWKQASKKTNSSMSLVHFGHYKAAAISPKVTAFLAKKITVIARSGCPPSCWGNGLQVMLEKIAGIALVNKLQAILLMEADNNFHNKFVFGYQALNALLETVHVLRTSTVSASARQRMPRWIAASRSTYLTNFISLWALGQRMQLTATIALATFSWPFCSLPLQVGPARW